ncbi:endothelin-converting enzyme homolog [Orussus abietinus]|uniref:endothelin-converting enzyme homolog n=1 Tax=Orussus abietinus TaxID=222816 RepID=UPI0006268C78|nr:endothelin-converting enzyme homolog [Orussus abietinus]
MGSLLDMASTLTSLGLFTLLLGAVGPTVAYSFDGNLYTTIYDYANVPHAHLGTERPSNPWLIASVNSNDAGPVVSSTSEEPTYGNIPEVPFGIEKPFKPWMGSNLQADDIGRRESRSEEPSYGNIPDVPIGINTPYKPWLETNVQKDDGTKTKSSRSEEPSYGNIPEVPFGINQPYKPWLETNLQNDGGTKIEPSSSEELSYGNIPDVPFGIDKTYKPWLETNVQNDEGTKTESSSSEELSYGNIPDVPFGIDKTYKPWLETNVQNDEGTKTESSSSEEISYGNIPDVPFGIDKTYKPWLETNVQNDEGTKTESSSSEELSYGNIPDVPFGIDKPYKPWLETNVQNDEDTKTESSSSEEPSYGNIPDVPFGIDKPYKPWLETNVQNDEGTKTESSNPSYGNAPKVSIGIEKPSKPWLGSSLVNDEISGPLVEEVEFVPLDGQEGLSLKSQYSTDNSSPSSNSDAVCLSEVCSNTAQTILNNLNSNVNPCDDFYEYSCGGSLKNSHIPLNEESWNQFVKARRNNDRLLRKILEERPKPGELLSTIEAKHLYRVCMDLGSIEKRGLKPIEKHIDTLGIWAVTKGQTEVLKAQLPWQQLDAHYGFHANLFALFDLSVRPDIDNATIRRLTLDQPTFTLPRSILTDNENEFNAHVAAYRKYMEEVILAFVQARGSDATHEMIAKEAHDMVDFEIDLAEILSPEELRKDVDRMNNLLSIDELQKLTDSALPLTSTAKINWRELLQSYFLGTDVNSVDSVLVLEKEYLVKLITVLEHTSEQTVANYVHWRFVNRMLPFTNEKMRQLQLNLKKDLFGVVEQHPRWIQCVRENEMIHTLSNTYLKKYVPQGIKSAVESMASEIETKLQVRIISSDWMDIFSKEAALRKLRDRKEVVGYPEWVKDDNAVMNYYKGFRVTNDYFENIIALRKFVVFKNLNDLKKPIDKHNSDMDATRVLTSYNPLANSLQISAGIFQPPFFSTEQPDAVNYGSLGALVGHEMSYEFIYFGEELDNAGNISAWSEQAKKAYKSAEQCFIKKFDGYPIQELEAFNVTIKVNGTKTLTENFADFAGIRAAYGAYKTASLKKKANKQKLPGLESISNDQLFFLSYANVMCDSARPEYLTYTVKSGKHSTSRSRVIGTLSDMDEFSNAFKCRKGSRMNPENKCTA